MAIERQNWPERYFPLAEYRDRWTKVEGEMKRRGYEVAVVWGRTAGNFERAMEILWLTNFFSSHSGLEPDAPDGRLWRAVGYACAILEPGKEPELIGDEPEPHRELLATTNYSWSANTIEAAAEALKRRRPQGPVAFVGGDCLPVRYADEFRAATPGIDYLFDDDLIRACRLVKSERELDCFREGAEICSSAMNRLCDGLYAGKVAAEAAADAAHEIVRRGGYPHRVPINFGETMYSAIERSPMYGFSQDAPERGELAWGMVYGPIHQGYWFDPSRTLVVGGRPTTAQRSLLEDSYSIVQAAMEMARPGVKVGDIAAECDRVKASIDHDSDYKEKAWLYYGHSNGMLWEPPFVNQALCGDDDVLRPGMVMGLECFITRRGVGAADWEENVIVTQDGIENLIKTPVFWH